jgi:hypothetical protein
MTKEEALDKIGVDTGSWKHEKAIHKAMDEYAKPYKEIAYLISRIFFYGNFKVETHSERILEQRLRMVGLWPTTENEIMQHPEIELIEQQNK